MDVCWCLQFINKVFLQYDHLERSAAEFGRSLFMFRMNISGLIIPNYTGYNTRQEAAFSSICRVVTVPGYEYSASLI
jgi:hypothetical protein